MIACTGSMYAKANNLPIPENTVVESQRISCAIETPYEDIQDLETVSDLIIMGNIEDTESFATVNGLIWTKEKIRVVETLKGNSAETIYVYKMGGRVSVGEYVDSFVPEVRKMKQMQYEAYDDSEFIEQSFYEEDLPNANTLEVLFLRKITKFGQHEEEYEPIGDYMGVYISDATYYPEATPSNMTTPSNASTILGVSRAIRNSDFSGYFGSFSYDELEALIR